MADADPFLRLDLCTPRPYALSEYARRLGWEWVQATLWRWSPRRAFGWRTMLLRLFGARLGSHVRPSNRCRVQHPWLLEIGQWSSMGDDVVIYNLGRVRIGRQTSISQGTYLAAGTHDYTRPDLPLIRSTINIGNGVWIAAQAFVGPGVTIGDDAVIGARSVVVGDIPPRVVAGGNPARPIKPRPTGDSPSPHPAATNTRPSSLATDLHPLG